MTARVLAVFRHPTPYRDGLLDRVAALPDVSLRVAYLGRTFAQTPWEAQPLAHDHRFPRGLLRRERSGHDVAFHPGALRELASMRPHACVLSGWSDPTVLACAAACRILRVPYVLCSESFEATGRFSARGRALAARVRRAMVLGAAAWLPAGSRARDHLVAHGADASRCHFFPTSPDSRRIADRVRGLRADRLLRASLGLPDRGVVAFVGRLVADKAPDVLLDAMALVGPRARLVVAGDGPLRDRLARHPAAGLATFLGFVQPRDVLRVLAASDAFALPSRYETWGAAAVEALAAGLPVVLSDRVGCAPDVLGGADPPGRVVPPEDPGALAAAIAAMLDAPRDEIAPRAVERAVAWGHDLNLRSIVRALRDAGAPLSAPALAAAGAA